MEAQGPFRFRGHSPDFSRNASTMWDTPRPMQRTASSGGDVLTVWIHALDAQNKKVQVTMHRPD